MRLRGVWKMSNAWLLAPNVVIDVHFTSITTMRTKCRSIATFHRPIHSHWSLPTFKYVAAPMHPHEAPFCWSPPPSPTLPLIMFRKEGQVCLHFFDNNMFVVEGNFRVFCHQNDRTKFVIFVQTTLLPYLHIKNVIL
jgi:hypothetical protein